MCYNRKVIKRFAKFIFNIIAILVGFAYRLFLGYFNVKIKKFIIAGRTGS